MQSPRLMRFLPVTIIGFLMICSSANAAANETRNNLDSQSEFIFQQIKTLHFPKFPTDFSGFPHTVFLRLGAAEKHQLHVNYVFYYVFSQIPIAYQKIIWNLYFSNDQNWVYEIPVDINKWRMRPEDLIRLMGLDFSEGKIKIQDLSNSQKAPLFYNIYRLRVAYKAYLLLQWIVKGQQLGEKEFHAMDLVAEAAFSHFIKIIKANSNISDLLLSQLKEESAKVKFFSGPYLELVLYFQALIGENEVELYEALRFTPPFRYFSENEKLLEDTKSKVFINNKDEMQLPWSEVISKVKLWVEASYVSLAESNGELWLARLEKARRQARLRKNLIEEMTLVEIVNQANTGYKPKPETVELNTRQLRVFAQTANIVRANLLKIFSCDSKLK